MLLQQGFGAIKSVGPQGPPGITSLSTPSVLHVSPSSSETGERGTSKAFSTLAQAVEVLQAGDVIELTNETHTIPTSFLTISVSCTIRANGRAKLQWPTTGTPGIVLSGSGTELILENVTLDHGSVWREITDGITAIKAWNTNSKVTLRNVRSVDFNNTVWMESPTGEVNVQGCTFLYTYGRAGVSNKLSSSTPGDYNHPCVPIIGNFATLIYRVNTFNGLVDSTFSGVAGSVPSGERVPADGPIQTGSHTYCDIDGNTMLNNGIECINISQAGVTPNAYHRIANNDIIGPNSGTLTGNYGGYSPGVRLNNCAGAEVIGNTIRNASHGVSIGFSSYSATNIVHIAANSAISCTIGIYLEGGVSEECLAEHNFVRNASQPIKAVRSGTSIAPTEMYGIYAIRGRFENNYLLSDEPAWDATTTLTSRASNVFTVASNTGITAGGWLFSYNNNTVSYYAVTGVSGSNTVTVSIDWSNAYPAITNGTLYFAAKGNNPTLPAGICVMNGGEIYAKGNTIVGHRNDVSTEYAGTGLIHITDHTLRGVRNVQPESATFIHAGMTSITAGKTLSASNTLTLAGTDGSTLNVGTGGTLGTAAYTAATAYATAAQVPNVQRQQLLSPAATISFTVPPGFNHLRITLVGRCTNASHATLRIRFNGDSAANYNGQETLITGGAMSAAGSAALTYIQMGYISGADAAAGAASLLQAFIPSYAQTSFWKTIQSRLWLHSTSNYDILNSGEWQSLSAITSIEFSLSGGTFATGFVATLTAEN